MFYELADYENNIKLINEGKMNINELCDTDKMNLMSYSFRKATQRDYDKIEVNFDDKCMCSCRELDNNCLCHHCNCN